MAPALCSRTTINITGSQWKPPGVASWPDQRSDDLEIFAVGGLGIDSNTRTLTGYWGSPKSRAHLLKLISHLLTRREAFVCTVLVIYKFDGSLSVC